MIQLHIAVAQRLHADWDDSPHPPVVCGPTAAFPEWQANDFAVWDRIMGPFIKEAGGTVDCVSVHLYDTMLDANYSLGATASHRTGSNVEAILDLQDAYGIQRHGRAMPLLLSEYGMGFKVSPVPFSTMADFQILRGVNGKLMQFMERPASVLKAVPFIVDKATWSHAAAPYPWVLWRMVDGQYEQTDLAKFYAFWQPVEGERFVVHSSDANVQVQGFVNETEAFVILNNLQSYAVQAELSWGGLNERRDASGGTITRLTLDNTTRRAALVTAPLSGALPEAITLQEYELVLLRVPNTLRTSRGASSWPAASVTEETYFANEGPLINVTGATQRFTFDVHADSQGVAYASLRLALAGNHSAIDLAPHVEINGTALVYHPAASLAGHDHVNPKDSSFLGALQIPVPVGLVSGSGVSVVAVTSAAATGKIVSVALVVGLRGR